MMLSLYTFVRDGLHYDYHVVDMLRHHLPLADEIIVNEGYSTDGTYEAISAIDSKIKVFRSDWGKPNGHEWFARFKNAARERCQGDWCVLLDCDEFVPEWEFGPLRQYLEHTKEIMIPLTMIHFYGNYKVFNAFPEKFGWPARKMLVHRNLAEIEIWGDGSNVRLRNTRPDWSTRSVTFSAHHFGAVRHPARFREKSRNVFGNTHRGPKRHWFNVPSALFDWLPHPWKDPQFLPYLSTYEGPHVKAVLDNPDEFVRDGFYLYDRLVRARGRAVPTQ